MEAHLFSWLDKKMKALDLSGKRFGKLQVMSLAKNNGNGRQWNCQCDCGKTTIVRTEYLRTGDTKSCGCLVGDTTRRRFTTHGFSKNRRGQAYNSWISMKARCFNRNIKEYQNYGAKGITVCDRWLKFENFIADMGIRPSTKHSLDRIDNSKNYGPENCRWASPTEQGRNRRQVIMIEINGKRLSALDIIENSMKNCLVNGEPIASFLLKNNLAISLRRATRKKLDGTVVREK